MTSHDMTTKFRKKPVEVDAIQWTNPEEAYALADWSDYAVRYDKHCSGPSDPETGEDWGRLEVTTLEGDHVATPRDWLIKGVQGEFYFCKPDIFAATYEPVTPAEELTSGE
jgi:hypothetical protein